MTKELYLEVSGSFGAFNLSCAETVQILVNSLYQHLPTKWIVRHISHVMLTIFIELSVENVARAICCHFKVIMNFEYSIS